MALKPALGEEGNQDTDTGARMYPWRGLSDGVHI